MARPAQLVAGLLAALLVCAGGALGDEVDKQRERLKRANDPVDHAKITVKLGDALLDKLIAAFRKGQTEQGERLLADYREAVLFAGRKLLSSGRDARRSPGGFKQLEIHIRQGERRLEDLSHGLSYDQVERIDETREELESLRQDLLAALMRVKPQSSNKGSAKEQTR
ncbi:MAG: hypothetical protein ACRD4D_05225 [Candidatus Acidiferrales bacterium]